MPQRWSPRVVLRAGAFAGLTLGATLVSDAHARLRDPREQRRIVTWHRDRWARRMLGLFGVVLHEEGPRPPRVERGRLVVANHRSALDIAILLHVFGGHVLSRADLARWPVVGYAARHVGTLFVDREHGGSRATAVRVIRRLLQEGQTVIVFAEGTTFGDDLVRPFNAGAFVAAGGLDVDIVPVGLAYEKGAEYTDKTFTAHLGRVAARKRTRVAVAYGAPIAPTRHAKEVAVRARDEVQELVTRARAAL